MLPLCCGAREAASIQQWRRCDAMPMETRAVDALTEDKETLESWMVIMIDGSCAVRDKAE
jgi:hypothetical protein